MIYFQLFYVFFIIGLFTFGGGYAMIPLLESEVVAKYMWLDEETFHNMIAISESTPGPIAVNMATFAGNQIAGPLGALVATVSVILPSFIIILLIAAIMNLLIEKPAVKAVLHGFQGVVIGLIFSTACYFLYNCFLIEDEELGKFDWRIIVIFAVIFLTAIIYKKIRKKDLSPYILLLMGGISGIILYLIN